MSGEQTRSVITGATGMLGRHAGAWLRFARGEKVSLLARADWPDAASLRAQIEGAGALYHFAALNRAADAEIDQVNDALTDIVAEAVQTAAVPPRVIVFSGSIHVDRDTVYGRMKTRVGERLAGVAAARGVGFVNAILPNIFGERGRPFSNSVVHTFCHQLAGGEEPQIHSDGEIELLHANDAIQHMCNAVDGIAASPAADQSIIRPHGDVIKVSDLKDRLEGFQRSYLEEGVVPDLESPFDVRLFNTLRSYYYPGKFPIILKHFRDDRGALAECIRAGGGGQVFYSTTHPGITRGNHFHFSKVERFIVLQGEASIRMRSVTGDNVSHEFRVSGEEPSAVDMPTLFTHNITNTGTEPLITLFWTNEFFDPDRPDTYPEIV